MFRCRFSPYRPYSNPCILKGLKGFDTAKAVASGVNLCRDLVNSPPNVLTPGALAAAAVKIAEENGLEAEILEVRCFRGINFLADKLH